MSTIKEIETAVSKLRNDQYRAFRAWFEEFDAKEWDAQVADDVASGKLDALADEALAELDKGKCSAL